MHIKGDDMEGLANIFMTSGVNNKGEGFVTISVHGDDKTILVGQLSPSEIRKHALAYLEVAEAADQDAAVLRVIRKLNLQDELAGLVITELRNSREE
jgi:hypothetical protein